MNTFYTPNQVRPYYSEITPVYQAAFAGEPWYEVSKCTDKLQRCADGLSAIAIGQTCDTCLASPSRPAYEETDLVDRFENIAATRPTDWYLERSGDNLALASVAWKATPSVIAQEKYTDPTMQKWLNELLGPEPIVWLDEIFADRTIRQKDNLKRFGSICLGFMDRLESPTLAYRTISPAMVAAAKRDFTNAKVYPGNIDVPDRRTIVVLNGESL